MGRTGRTPPVPPLARQRIAQGDAELVAAQLAGHPAERFVHGHLAALRFAAALIACRVQPVSRRRPRSVWDSLNRVEPALAGWAAFFAAGAAERAAVEAGRGDVVSTERAEQVVAAAEDFRDVVGELLGLADGGSTRRAAAQAS